MGISDQQIREEIQRLAESRSSQKTFCPSEVARALAEDWRPLMDRVRVIAGQEVEAGRLLVLQRGVAVEMASARGPIRLRKP